MSEKIRIALADDHPILLAGLCNLIEAEPDFELVGKGTSGQVALKMIREQLPDVAIVDISMPEINGITVARRLADECPNVRVVILTLYEERSFLNQALAAGAKGYVLKRSAAENLVCAIRVVHLRDIYIDPVVSDGVGDKVQADTPGRIGNILGLTDRESDVLKYSARGLTIKEIAGRLELSAKTVETYKASASEKLGLKTRAEIVRFAAAQSWLEEF